MSRTADGRRGRRVEAVWRIESARIVAALTRFTGDFGLAEDAAQEAVAEALVSWPLDGSGQSGRLADGHGPAAGDRRDPPPGRAGGPVRQLLALAEGEATAGRPAGRTSTPTGSTTTCWR